METAYIIGAGVVATGVVVALWFKTRAKDPLKAAVEEAIESRKVRPIIAAIEERSLTDKKNAWHKVLDQLWGEYERELAARLLVEAAKVHDSDLIPRWTQQITEIEPSLAMRVLGRKFILETLKLPDDAIPKLGPRRGQRQVSQKRGAKKKRKK